MYVVVMLQGKVILVAGFVQWTTFCTGRRRGQAFFVQVPGKGDFHAAHGRRHRAQIREQRTPLFSAAEKADRTQQVNVSCGLNVWIPALSLGSIFAGGADDSRFTRNHDFTDDLCGIETQVLVR